MLFGHPLDTPLPIQCHDNLHLISPCGSALLKAGKKKKHNQKQTKKSNQKNSQTNKQTPKQKPNQNQSMTLEMTLHLQGDGDEKCIYSNCHPLF